jgi:membrane glycosyltransferase
MLVAVGLALAVKVALSGPDYFLGPSLFPIWSALESERAIRLFILSMGVLLTPKFLGWTAAEVNLRRSRAFGGPVLLTLSARAEIFLSALYAPVLMLVQTQFVWQVLRGGLFLWTLPVTGALILSPVTSWLSGRKYAGVVLQRLGILRTPEERGNATH